MMTHAHGPKRVEDGPSILNQPRVIPGPGPAPHNDARHGWDYEKPLNNPAIAEVWCYTPRYSYRSGETIDFHVHATRPVFEIEISREGPAPELVYHRSGIPATASPTPANPHVVGCGWPVAHQVTVSSAWRSGFYVVVVRVRDDDGGMFEREHFVVVKPAVPASSTSIAFVVSTATMNAYNDWGGGNSYHGEGGTPRFKKPNARTSLLRPWSRGLVKLPGGAPRAVSTAELPPFAVPSLPAHAYAHHYGFARDYGDASWALYGKLFVEWAEANGYTLDYYTLHDLHDDPQILVPYRLSIVVGHDEYSSWQMRQAIENQLAAGGNHARFAGNNIWQVRIEDDGTTFVNHKDETTDPLLGTDQERFVSNAWDLPCTGWPLAHTFGLTGSGAIHAMYGGAAPRASGGFTIYRPWHWSLEGSDLYYGDVLGGRPDCIAAYEIDGCDFTMRDGLPYPTGKDGAPATLSIVAMAPAVLHEEDHFNGRMATMMNSVSNPSIKGDGTELPHLEEHEGARHPKYGAGMIASYDRGLAAGDGTMFVAGATDWVVGLQRRSWFVEKVTRNVLDRLSGPAPARIPGVSPPAG
jgi:hypothetical protein